MTITKAAILKVAPAADQYADELLRQMKQADITTPLRAAHFLGQIYQESGGFTVVVESLNYSATALKKLFGRHRISLADCDKFGRTNEHAAHQNALANILYGGKWGQDNLGNTEPGDGWRFRGRGLKQLTGRDNYRRFSHAWLGSDELLVKPERVADPDGAVASAIWFWTSRGLNATADTNDVAAVTRKVNGGTNGLPERRQWTAAFLKSFGGAA